MDVRDDDQVDRLGPGEVVGQVGADGADRQSLGGQPAQRDLGQVDGNHLPALAGQPQAVAALASPQVERSARSQPADQLDERGVRLPWKESLGVHVAVVPSVYVMHGCSSCSASMAAGGVLAFVPHGKPL